MNKHRIVHPDGTVSTRNSKNRTYQYAVVLRTDPAKAADYQETAAEQYSDEIAAIEAALTLLDADGQDAYEMDSGGVPSSLMGLRRSYYVSGCWVGSTYQKEDEATPEPPTVESAKKYLAAARLQALRLEAHYLANADAERAGVRYEALAWSRDADTAAKALRSRDNAWHTAQGDVYLVETGGPQ